MQNLFLLILILGSSVSLLSCASTSDKDPVVSVQPTPEIAVTPIVQTTSRPDTTQQAEITTNVGNIRIAKSLKSEILKVLPQYSWVEVLTSEGAWLHVKARSGEVGWINRNATKMLAPISNTPSYSGGTGGSRYPTNSSDDIPNGKELYDEVQRLKERDGLTDREAVRKILREMGEIQ